ncbi:thiamine pyrophosphate-requiring enzymes [Zymobacter palmae]|uniref:Thiamine pyrophosphate-requiring enzymes n=1 Tax=Zymobacter palmae TaxID=33074 RepID=A0A348HHF5_9GAMM|nr:thiamine pyrophosphate-requiring enzymes [Zymobacter palmae]
MVAIWFGSDPLSFSGCAAPLSPTSAGDLPSAIALSCSTIRLRVVSLESMSAMALYDSRSSAVKDVVAAAAWGADAVAATALGTTAHSIVHSPTSSSPIVT